MKRLIYLALFPLLFAAFLDVLSAQAFLKRADSYSVLVQENLSSEKRASEGLPKDIVYVCLSGCSVGEENKVSFRLKFSRALLLTGKSVQRDYVHYRKLP